MGREGRGVTSSPRTPLSLPGDGVHGKGGPLVTDLPSLTTVSFSLIVFEMPADPKKNFVPHVFGLFRVFSRRQSRESLGVKFLTTDPARECSPRWTFVSGGGVHCTQSCDTCHVTSRHDKYVVHTQYTQSRTDKTYRLSPEYKF